MINFYNFYRKSKILYGFKMQEKIPRISWRKYIGSLSELKKREKLWAADKEIALRYTFEIGTRFYAGEECLIKNKKYWECYNTFLKTGQRHIPWGETGYIFLQNRERIRFKDYRIY